VVIAPQHPTRLLPGDNLNPTEELLVDVLYDPLYRLDQQMRPVPELAKDLPTIKQGGTILEIPIKADARFHSGEKLKADDVRFSLNMARSLSCPLGHTLCRAVNTYVQNVTRDDNVVKVKLTEPYAPFVTEVLGRLPILSEDDVKKATGELVAAADRLNAERPDRIISRIIDDTLRDECLEPEPPAGCLLSDHRETLEQIFRRARIDLPPEAPYVDATGLFDEDAYLGDLLRRLEALAQVFDSQAQDKNSAALALLDATVESFGGGPYQLVRIGEDGTYYLEANEDHTRSAPKIERMEIRVEPNPSVATTRLLTGEADWLLETNPEQAAVIEATPGYRAASRAEDTQYGILFNVRPDRIYFDVNTRRAFVECIDHRGLGTALDADRHLATTPFTATAWAQPEAELSERDVASANAWLERAGWRMGEDGVRAREDGTRLSSTIAVRPTSVDLFTFANQAAEQLAECGIELIVEELDLTGDAMLTQLVYPNDFDTLLWSRPLGPDPDSAVRAFESSRLTTEKNRADENPSGFTSELVDYHVASARETLDTEERIAAYAAVQGEIETLIPYWPLWYDSSVSAVTERLTGRDGPIDPSRSRYDWDISSWSFRSEAVE
jgi:ABC-type transport system substrate-binding protein